MKKLLLVAVAFMIHISGIWAQKTEYKIVTSIESIVPMGIGRSRIIENDEPRDYTAFCIKSDLREPDPKGYALKNAQGFEQIAIVFLGKSVFHFLFNLF